MLTDYQSSFNLIYILDTEFTIEDDLYILFRILEHIDNLVCFLYIYIYIGGSPKSVNAPRLIEVLLLCFCCKHGLQNAHLKSGAAVIKFVFFYKNIDTNWNIARWTGR